LFFEYADILNHYEPKYFLLENVKMKKEWQDVISSYLGVEPVKINSALVSAQNRERLYWTNISNIEQPNDLEIFVYDILEDNVDEKYYMSEKWHKWWEENKDFQLRKKYSALNPDKAITMKARQYANWNENFICGAMRGRYLENGIRKDGKGKPTQRIEVRFDSKTNCLTTVQKDNLLINESENRIRRFTPIECERLQTLPDNYTAGVNDSQRYKMIGNGWTVDVIAHIFSYLKINKQAVNI
jgi:DNA (cytosine-5)-methyltransferase 3A